MELSKILSKPEQDLVCFEMLNNISKKLIHLYHIDKENFHKFFNQNDNTIIKFKKWLMTHNFLNYNLDISEEFYEIAGYFRTVSIKKKTPKKNYKPFTLRNAKDLATFEAFLDKIVYLACISPKHFVLVFPRCPLVFWDKIEELREASIKYKRDSPTFIRCLKKSKFISYLYSDLVDYFMFTQEDELFTDPYEEEYEDEDEFAENVNEVFNDQADMDDLIESNLF